MSTPQPSPAHICLPSSVSAPSSAASHRSVPGTAPIRESASAACRAGERISFGFLTSQKFTGNHATVRVLRDGQPRELDIELVVPRPLVPIHLNNQEPSYLVVSGELPAC